jgi:hypothetical protein
MKTMHNSSSAKSHKLKAILKENGKCILFMKFVFFPFPQIYSAKIFNIPVTIIPFWHVRKRNASTCFDLKENSF